MKKILGLLILLLTSCQFLVRDDLYERQEIRDHTVRMQMHVLLDLSSFGFFGEGATADIGWSGSGSVVATSRSRGESLVLTAKHVCAKPSFIEIGPFAVPVVAAKLSVQTVDGIEYNAEPLVEDLFSDDCVVRVYGIAGSSARIADDDPPFEAKVYIAGSPMGEMQPGVVPLVDGYYAGVAPYMTSMGDVRQMVFTTAVAPGNSGSAIYYNGDIVSVVSMRHVEFEHLTYGTYRSRLQATLALAKQLW